MKFINDMDLFGIELNIFKFLIDIGYFKLKKLGVIINLYFYKYTILFSFTILKIGFSITYFK